MDYHEIWYRHPSQQRMNPPKDSSVLTIEEFWTKETLQRCWGVGNVIRIFLNFLLHLIDL